VPDVVLRELGVLPLAVPSRSRGSISAYPDEPCTSRGVRTVCAVRRVITSPIQSGSARRRCLGYQLTRDRKTNGTGACWEKGATARRRCRAGGAFALASPPRVFPVAEPRRGQLTQATPAGAEAGRGIGGAGRTEPAGQLARAVVVVDRLNGRDVPACGGQLVAKDRDLLLERLARRAWLGHRDSMERLFATGQV
jgi:hypothetical protein